jgi:hypothetical protein
MKGSAEKLSGVIVRQLIDGGALCSGEKPADSKQVAHWEYYFYGKHSKSTLFKDISKD